MLLIKPLHLTTSAYFWFEERRKNIILISSIIFHLPHTVVLIVDFIKSRMEYSEVRLIFFLR